MERILTIIARAVREFHLEVDMTDKLEDIYCEACNVIEDSIDYDRIDVCERNHHYDHIAWNDGKGFACEADGEFITGDASSNRYFRNENGEWREIVWYDQNEDDYVLMERVIDSDGLVVALVCK